VDTLTIVIGGAVALHVLQTIQVAILGRDVRRSLRPPPPPTAPPPLGGAWQLASDVDASQLRPGRRVRYYNTAELGRISDEPPPNDCYVRVTWDAGDTSNVLVDKLLVDRRSA
jgi:hypothetical protein